MAIAEVPYFLARASRHLPLAKKVLFRYFEIFRSHPVIVMIHMKITIRLIRDDTISYMSESFFEYAKDKLLGEFGCQMN